MSKLIRKTPVEIAFHYWIVRDSCFSGHHCDLERFFTFVKTFYKRQKTMFRWKERMFFRKKCKLYGRLQDEQIDEYYTKFICLVDFLNTGECLKKTFYIDDDKPYRVVELHISNATLQEKERV